MKHLLVILMGVLTSVAGAEREGHGGDDHVWEFVYTSHDVHRWLRANAYRVIPRIDPDLFLKTVERAEIVSTERELPLERAAYNFPKENRIEISRKRWPRMHEPRTRWGVVLHEVLPMMGIVDDDYKISTHVADLAFFDRQKPAGSYLLQFPQCRKSFVREEGEKETGDGFYWGIEFRKPGTGGLDLELVTGRISSQGEDRPSKRVLLATGVRCAQSTLHGTILECTGDEKATVRFERTTHLELYSSPQHQDRHRIEVQAARIERLYAKGLFQFIDPNGDGPQELSVSQWEGLEAGKLPLFKKWMSWAQADRFAKQGYRGLDQSLAFEFKAIECLWLSP
jgi:hypothetical protein